MKNVVVVSEAFGNDFGCDFGVDLGWDLQGVFESLLQKPKCRKYTNNQQFLHIFKVQGLSK